MKEAGEGIKAIGEVLMLQWKEPGVIVAEQESGVKKQLDFADEKAGKIYASREGTPPPPPCARERVPKSMQEQRRAN
jgi:hypothetical protein